MDTTESSAPHAHPPTEDHDDTVEAHYACLERPCACLDGWVFVGYIDEYGEERSFLPLPPLRGKTTLTFAEWGIAKPTIPHSPSRSWYQSTTLCEDTLHLG
jgi:hypothetical protein